ncbi:MICOS complex subunit MIC27 isoform X4 [Coccinella septempunctata]|uniref:MICOS complex subunit MIC27 isoform X4 n=1 Tax=Coccinella septempunctata TaxID=41139 RepID=UPI001D06EFF4|nr:MICOS complex subunit MIC27 isoform X4 [Coccinella septempunctata]
MITSDGNSDTSKKGLICKPSELPIYSPDIPVPQCIEERPTWFGNFLQAKVSSLRQLIDTVVHEAKAYENVAEDYIKDGVDKADGALTYLRQENNTVPKVGAIAIGGLTGLILSLRKGFFKRTLYTAAGATVMTAICYPKQTSEYSQIGMREGKKYATIAYNFAYGDKADSDNKCTTRADLGKEDESDEELSSRNS